MSFYGATTPAFTEQEFVRERESFTDAERRKLQSDVYGAPDDNDEENVIQETPTLIQSSLALLDEAINALPDEEKSSYLLAKERVPELVQEESPPLAFLRCEAFDPWSAAKRLAGYWSFRKQLFGHDRAFLPMTLDGAMQQDYEEFVRCAFACPVDDDIHGRVVIFWDRIRASDVSRDVVLRCCLYVLTKLHSRPEFSLQGFVALVNYQNCDLRKHYDRTLTRQLTVLIDSCAAKMKAIHLCSGPGRSVVGVLLPVLRRLAGSYIRQRTVIHSGWGSDVLPYFQDYGLKETHSQVMYAANKLAIVQAWIYHQQQLERDR